MNGEHALFANPLASAAGLAGLRDDLSRSFALPAGAADAEEALLETHLALSLAGWAHLDGGGGFCAGSLAVCTGFPTRNFEFGFFAEDRFFETQFEIVLEIVTALRSRTSARLPKKVFEDVVENIAEAALSSEVESLGSLWSTGMAECIVPTAFLLVADDLVSFVELLEFFLCGLLLLGRGV